MNVFDLVEDTADHCGCGGGSRWHDALTEVLLLAEEARIRGTLIAPDEITDVVKAQLL